MADWLDYLVDPTSAIDDALKHYTGDLFFPKERYERRKAAQNTLGTMGDQAPLMRAPPPGFAPPPMPPVNLNMQSGQVGAVPYVSGGVTLNDLGNLKLRGGFVPGQPGYSLGFDYRRQW